MMFSQRLADHCTRAILKDLKASTQLSRLPRKGETRLAFDRDKPRNSGMVKGLWTGNKSWLSTEPLTLMFNLGQGTWIRACQLGL